MEKTKQPTGADRMRALAAGNVQWHESGTLSRGSGRAKVHLYDYVKADKVTEEQRQAIKAACPLVEFFGASPAYAPEIKKVIIAFPKAARMRELRESQLAPAQP